MAKNPSVGWSLGELALLLGGEADGPSDLQILRPAPAGYEDGSGLTFAENEKYLEKAISIGFGAILVRPGIDTHGRPAIRVDHPRRAFGQFLAMCQRPLPLGIGIHPTAVISEEAEVHPEASVGPYAVIEAGATIGAGCKIFPFAYVGENCHLGDSVTIYPHAVLYQDVTVGTGSIIHAGAILGADGFGFAWDGKKQNKIPQVGSVTIGRDAEIGANTTIDRATAGVTNIGDDTKLDNLIMIGHNTEIGEHTVIAALCGISGSSKIGDRVTIAGQVATSDHRSVCDDVTLGGRSGVTRDITEPGVYWGLPARPMIETTKILALTHKLPEMYERLRELEQKVKELEAGVS